MENLLFIYPEIFLSITAMMLLMFGAFHQKEGTSTLILSAASFSFIVALYIFLYISFDNSSSTVSLFNGGFEYSDYTYILKILVLLCAFGVTVISTGANSYAGKNKNCFEFPVLIILATIGANLLISATDLIAVYVGLELLSLATYVIVSLNRDNDLASEAGVKYFILGALASGLILFGSSLLYGFTGTTNLAGIFDRFAELAAIENSIGIVIGLVLVLSGFIFKISAVPMHMWAPDVYQGCSKPVLTFLSTVPKIAAFAFFIRVTYMIPEYASQSFMQIIILVSAASMLLGGFAGLKQHNLKRLLAYSSIANIGYILVAVAVGTESSIEAAIIYLIIYMITIIGIFAILSLINQSEKFEDNFDILSGLSKTNPVRAFSLSVLIFSVAGIPPMAGFMAKFFVFAEAVKEGFYVLSVIGVISSVVACFYYLKIIKTMYFDDAKYADITIKSTYGTKFLITATVIFSLTYILYVNKVTNLAKQAVSGLLN